MSADFWFGVVIGGVVLLVGVVALLIWARGFNKSVAERSLEQLRLRNRLYESQISVLQGMSGWLGELVEHLKDADDLPSSAQLAAESAAGGREEPVLGGCADGGTPLTEAQVREVLGTLMRRYWPQGVNVPAGVPGALFQAVMDLEAEREARAGARDEQA